MLPTPEQLTKALQESGILHDNVVQNVRILETFDAYADIVARLAIDYKEANTNAPKTLVCKVFGTNWYASSGKAELSFYRDLAPQMPEVPVPTFYGYLDSREHNCLSIFIEDLQTHYQPVQFPLAPASLESMIDTLVSLHVLWWEHPDLENPRFLQPEHTVTRMPQALLPDKLALNFAQAKQSIHEFQSQHSQALSYAEKDLLRQLVKHWQPCFQRRIADSNAITLIHGDFHLLGNIFLAKHESTVPPLKIIDWAQAKRGLGVHDLMYALLSVKTENRVARDTHALEYYYQGLMNSGVKNYSWEQCLWDYRFSLLTNVFQSVFQNSVPWLRKTVEIVEAWEACALLSD